MKVNLTLEPAEAAQLVAALAFVRRNMALNPDTLRYQFVNGGRFDCSVQDLFSMGYLETAIDEAREEAINTHPFNPYIHCY